MAPHYEMMEKRRKLFSEAAKAAELQAAQNLEKATRNEVKNTKAAITTDRVPIQVVAPAVPILVNSKPGAWNKVVANGGVAAKKNIEVEKKDTGAMKSGNKKPNGTADNKPKPAELKSAGTDGKQKPVEHAALKEPAKSSNMANGRTHKPVDKNRGRDQQAPGIKLVEASRAQGGDDQVSACGQENSKPPGQKKKWGIKGRSHNNRSRETVEMANPAETTAPAAVVATTTETAAQKDSATTDVTRTESPNPVSEGQQRTKKKNPKNKKKPKRKVPAPGPMEDMEIQADIPYGRGILLPLGRIPALSYADKPEKQTLPGSRYVSHRATQVLHEEARQLALLDTTPVTLPEGKDYVFDIRVVPPYSTVFKTGSYYDRVGHAIRRVFSDTNFDTVVGYSVPVPNAGLLMPMVEDMNEVKIWQTAVEVGFMAGYPGEKDFPYNSFNRLQRFYAVAVGGEIGIFENWSEVSQSILDVEDPKYRVFPTRASAQKWICEELNKERSELARLKGFYADMEELHYHSPGPKAKLLMKVLGVSISILTPFVDEDREVKESEEITSQKLKEKEPEVSMLPETKKSPIPRVKLPPPPKVVKEDPKTSAPEHSESPNLPGTEKTISTQPQSHSQDKDMKPLTFNALKESKSPKLADETAATPQVHITQQQKPKKYSEVVSSSIDKVKVEPAKLADKASLNDKVVLKDKVPSIVEPKAPPEQVSSSESTQSSAATKVDNVTNLIDELPKKPAQGKPNSSVPSFMNKIGLRIGVGGNNEQSLQDRTEDEPPSDQKGTTAVVQTLTRSLGLFIKDEVSGTAQDALKKSLRRNASNDGVESSGAVQPNNANPGDTGEGDGNSKSSGKRGGGEGRKKGSKNRKDSQRNAPSGSQGSGKGDAKGSQDASHRNSQGDDDDEDRGRRRDRTDNQQRHPGSLPISPSREPFVYRDPPRVAKSAPEFMVRNPGRRNSFWMRRPQPAPDDPTMDSSTITLTESDTGDHSFMKDLSKALGGGGTFDDIQMLPTRLSPLLKKTETDLVTLEPTSKAAEPELESVEAPKKIIGDSAATQQENSTGLHAATPSNERTDKLVDDTAKSKLPEQNLSSEEAASRQLEEPLNRAVLRSPQENIPATKNSKVSGELSNDFSNEFSTSSHKALVLNESTNSKKTAELAQPSPDKKAEDKGDSSKQLQMGSSPPITKIAITAISSNEQKELSPKLAVKLETPVDDSNSEISVSKASAAVTNPTKLRHPSAPASMIKVSKEQSKKGSSPKRAVSVAIPNLAAEVFLGRSRQPSGEQEVKKAPSTPSSSEGARSPSASVASAADEQLTASTSPATEPREQVIIDVSNKNVSNKKGKKGKKPMISFGDVPKFAELGESHKRPFMSSIFSTYPPSGRTRSVPPRKKFKFEERSSSSSRSSRSSSVNSKVSTEDVKNAAHHIPDLLGRSTETVEPKGVRHHVIACKRNGSWEHMPKQRSGSFPEQSVGRLTDRRNVNSAAVGLKTIRDKNNIIPALPRVFERNDGSDIKWRSQKPSYAEVMGLVVRKSVENKKEPDQFEGLVQTYVRLGQARQTAKKQSSLQMDTTIDPSVDSVLSPHTEIGKDLDTQREAKRLTDALDVIENRLNELRARSEADKELLAQKEAEKREAEVEAEHREIIRQLELEEQELKRREEWEKAKILEEKERLQAEQSYRQRLADDGANGGKADEEGEPHALDGLKLQENLDPSMVDESEPKAIKVWAVARGKNKGIFYEFEEAQESVKGYQNSLFKMFKSREAAEKWLKEQESDTYLDQLYQDKLADEKPTETTTGHASEEKLEPEPLKKKPTQLWGVSIGRTTGLFDDHDEVQQSVYKFKGAEYKRFNKLKDAEQWLASKGITTTKESEEPEDNNFGGVWYTGDLENRPVYPTFHEAAYSERSLGPFFATDPNDELHSAPASMLPHWCLIMEVETLYRTGQGELQLEGLDIEWNKVSMTIVDPDSLRCTQSLRPGDTIAMLYGRPHIETQKGIPVMRVLKENEKFVYCFHNCSLKDLRSINASAPTSKRKDIRGPCDQCDEICHLNHICEPCGVATYCSHRCRILAEEEHKPICDNVAYFSRLFDYDWGNNNNNKSDDGGDGDDDRRGLGGIDFNHIAAGIVMDYSARVTDKLLRGVDNAIGGVGATGGGKKGGAGGAKKRKSRQ